MKQWKVTFALGKYAWYIEIKKVIFRAPSLLHAWILAARYRNNYYPHADIHNIELFAIEVRA